MWISVDDRLPEDDNMVIIWWITGKVVRGVEEAVAYRGHFSHMQGYWRPEGSNGNFNDNVTHWQPLPPPPE